MAVLLYLHKSDTLPAKSTVIVELGGHWVRQGRRRGVFAVRGDGGVAGVYNFYDRKFTRLCKTATRCDAERNARASDVVSTLIHTDLDTHRSNVTFQLSMLVSSSVDCTRLSDAIPLFQAVFPHSTIQHMFDRRGEWVDERKETCGRPEVTHVCLPLLR